MERSIIEATQHIKEIFGDDPIIFLKFGNNIGRLKQIQEGSLFMNNLQFYIDREEETGECGMGDRLEVLNVVNDIEISIYDNVTDQLLVTAPAISASIRYNDAVTKPVFCLYAVTIDMMEVIEVHGNQYKCRLNFDSEALESIKEEFGEHVLVIMAKAFAQRMQRDFQEKNYEFRAKMVEYADYSVNDSERIRNHVNGSTDLFFYKEQAFAHQKEFRIVIFNKDIEHGYSEPFPSIEDVSKIFSTDSLKEGDDELVWWITMRS